jgi:hypothetical protein
MPTRASVSPWSKTLIGGYAICGLLAHAIETATDAEGFIPARLTADLFKPVRAEPVSVRSKMIRRGPRIIAIEATVVQAGEPAARATAIYLPPTEDPPGQVWRSPESDPVRPPDDHDVPAPIRIRSADAPWQTGFANNDHDQRKTIWVHYPSVVDDEPITPFQKAALIAENTSLVCNWGTHGLGFINADATLALTRLPRGRGIGLRADDQLSSKGIAVGTATLFDHDGPVGKCGVTAIANAERQAKTRVSSS